MKYKLKAKKDVNTNIGSRRFENKKGETVEMTGVQAEAALSNMMAGNYELIAEVPETDEEKAAVKAENDNANAEKSEAKETDNKSDKKDKK